MAAQNLQGDTTTIVDYLVENAVKSRATDIHLEPGRDKFNVRYRIDGILYKVESFGTLGYCRA